MRVKVSACTGMSQHIYASRCNDQADAALHDIPLTMRSPGGFACSGLLWPGITASTPRWLSGFLIHESLYTLSPAPASGPAADRRARGQRSVLLEGVPGCGKSMLLRAIANELEGVSVCIAGPDQICRHGSVDVLKELIEMTAPCVVFIEEIDIFGADRRRGGNPGMAELMQVMDGLGNVPGVRWVGTTNRPEVVETALADRPGRFDRRLKFGPLPDTERSQLVERMIQPQRLTAEALELATGFTDNMTGAQVRDLAETLRIISDKEEFDASDVREAWEDCGFKADQPFGFANAIG